MYFFISYRHEDRQLAGRIAQYLHDDHHECFLAHDDLELTPDFEKEIKQRIKDCTALIAVVTPSFAEAAYPNQEVGYALALDKPIIPIWFPDVKGEELGFIKRVQSIHAKEDNLHQSVLKAVEWAETSLTENFVHPTDGGPLEKAIDGFLELRREPYYRVLIRPQGMYDLFSPSTEHDDWLVSNKPRLFDHMDWKTRKNGIEFTHQDPVRAEVDWTGALCYGRVVPREDGIVLEAFVRIIAQLFEYSRRIFDKYGWNQQQHSLLRIDFKIGHVHGQSLKTFYQSEFSGMHASDLNEVEVEEAVPITFEENALLVKLLVKVCRQFGFGMRDTSAKDWVMKSLRG